MDGSECLSWVWVTPYLSVQVRDVVVTCDQFWLLGEDSCCILFHSYCFKLWERAHTKKLIANAFLGEQLPANHVENRRRHHRNNTWAHSGRIEGDVHANLSSEDHQLIVKSWFEKLAAEFPHNSGASRAFRRAT